MRSTTTARVLSLVGHPALLMPVAVTLAARLRGAPARDTWLAAAAAVAVALLVGLYSLRQVRARRWLHMDASQPAERLHLNLLLVGALLAAAAALGLGARSLVLAAGLASSALIVLAALALRRRMKLSLHCAFASYAAALLWPVLPAVAGVALLALAVGWSRLQLRRHTPREVVVGLGVGALAGLAFNLLAT